MSRRVMRGFDPKRLIEARAAYGGGAGISIGALARISRVSVTALRRWEEGETVPQIDKLRVVAEAIGIAAPMEQLIRIPRNERYPIDWRALFGLLQPTLGGLVGIETTTISQIERGQRSPSAAQAEAIAQVYGITVTEFMECFERARMRPVNSKY